MAPCQSFVFYNNKGGVGKTFLAFNFAVEMCMRRPEKRVLIIDMDAQCNASALCLGGGQHGQQLVGELISNGKTIKQLLMRRMAGQMMEARILNFITNVKERRYWNPANGKLEDYVPSNLELVCGSVDLDIFASRLEEKANMSSMFGKETPFRDIYALLYDAVRELGDEYIVVMDTNPSFGISTRLALIACDELMVPTTIDEFSGGGVRNLIVQLGGKTNESAVNDPLTQIVSFNEMMRQKQAKEKLDAALSGMTIGKEMKQDS